MSNFDDAISFLLMNEGGLSNHPDDGGGVTNCGIIVDDLKAMGEWGDLNNDGDIDHNDIRQMTRDQAIIVWRRQYWDRWGYSKINPQDSATKLFDASAVFGPYQAGKCAQRAVCACKGQSDYLKIDGIVGPVTRAAINGIWPVLFCVSMASEMAGVFRAIVTKLPAQRVFLTGWLARAYRHVDDVEF